MTFSDNLFFFFNDTATTEIYTLSLHDALPIFRLVEREVWDKDKIVPKHERSGSEPLAKSIRVAQIRSMTATLAVGTAISRDRKSTRLNSSHANISYAVFCLKKKNSVDS